MAELTIGNWIAIAALIVGTVGASFTSANYLVGHRERRRIARNAIPKVKATINPGLHEGGWRSVQLHVVPAEDDQQNFQYANWRIERARILRPKTAILARAAGDDYASGVFYPENPVRVLEGKLEGLPQRFALEYFIRFLEERQGQKATFKVMFSHTKTQARRTTVVTASVPDDRAHG